MKTFLPRSICAFVALAAATWSGSSVAPRSAQGAAPQPGTAPNAPAEPGALPLTDIAFFDGADVPVDALAFFPVVVLRGDRATPESVRALARAGSHPVARLSWPSTGPPDELLALARRLAAARHG